MTEKDTYTTRMKFLLDEMNASIKELEILTKQRDSVTQSIFHDEMRKLKEQAEIAREKLTQLRSAGANSWSELVIEYDHLFQALSRSYQYFKTQI